MSDRSRLRRIGRLLRYSLLGILAFFVAVVVLTIGLLLTDTVTAPAWVQVAANERIKTVIGDSDVSTGKITLAFDPFKFSFVLHIHDVSVTDHDGGPLADLRDIRVKADVVGLLEGKVEIGEVAANEIDVWLPSKSAATAVESSSDSTARPVQGQMFGNPALVLDALDRGIGSNLRTVSIARLGVRFRGAETRDWSFRNGLIAFDRSQNAISAAADFEVSRGGGEMLPLSISVSSVSDESSTSIKVDLIEVDAFRFASRLFGLDVPGAAEFPAAGTLEAHFSPQGEMTRANASIRVGAVSVELQEEGEPIEIRFASGQIEFDPESGRFAIASLAIDSNAALINAEGHAYLNGSGSAAPAIEGSLKFEDAFVDPPGAFEAPVQNLAGVLDFRLGMSPLNLEVMRFALKRAETTLTAKLNVSLAENGWRVRSDFHADILPESDLIAMWPIPLVANTREWMRINFLEGEVYDVNGALRIDPGSRPSLLVTYKFTDMRLHFLGELPPVEDGAGYGVITLDDAFVSLDKGMISFPDSEFIDLSGSSLAIPDSNDPYVPARVGLKVAGPIIPILAVLNRQPLMLLDKGGIRSDFATGFANGDAELRFPLLKNLGLDDVEVAVSGTLENVVAADLFEGKAFRAERLEIGADSASLSLSGDGRLGNLPVTGAWTKRYADDSGGESALRGSMEISNAFLEEFGIELPGDSISGVGTASFEMNLDLESEPTFKIMSDLRGLSSELPALNWAKLQEDEGALVVEGVMSEPMALDRIELSANGLSAAGTARMSGGGGLEQAEFEYFRIDDWLDISLVLRGAESLAITGGFLDSSLVEPSGSAPEDGAGVVEVDRRPVGVNLDRVKISDSIELSGFSGELNFGGGVEGRYAASINGRANIKGTIAPYEGGSAINIQSDNAGDVMRAAGIIQNLHGGSFRMRLLPKGGNGEYRGRIVIDESRVKNMPVLGELLNYVSIVGIIDQLAGEGIHFSEVTVDFEVGEEGIEVLQGIAIGSSIGITMVGNYDLASEHMDMEGMVTPFFALNQFVGAITPLPNLFGIKKGEGFGGIYFTINGPAEDPEVQIDPSSVLTPGVLNRIFRQ